MSFEVIQLRAALGVKEEMLVVASNVLREVELAHHTKVGTSDTPSH